MWRVGLSAVLLSGLLVAPVAGQSRQVGVPAGYDPELPVLLRGEVVSIDMTGPSAAILLKIQDEQAAQREWLVSWGNAETTTANGLSEESLPPGTLIIVRGYQSIDQLCEPVCRAHVRDITLNDGVKMIHRSARSPRP